MIRDDGTVRKLRRAFNDPCHTHELTFSCYKRIPLLVKDRTRLWFVEALDRARTDHRLVIWAYVIMPEHAHVLVCPRSPQYDISVILKAIKQSVSRRAMFYLRGNAPDWLDRLRVVWPGGRTEHRFWTQGGGYDRNMFRRETIRKSIDYIHNNPVRRGLSAAATDWRWSSAQWYAGVADVPLEIDPVEW